MKPENPALIEEVDVMVVNRQPTADERQEISAFLRAYKAKAKRPVSSTRKQKTTSKSTT